MSEPLNCPRCAGILTDSEVRSLHKRYASAQRKTKSGGKNGGRRPTPQPERRETGTAFPPLPSVELYPRPKPGDRITVQYEGEVERVLVPIEDL